MMNVVVRVCHNKQSYQTLLAVGYFRDDDRFEALSFEFSHVLEFLDKVPIRLSFDDYDYQDLLEQKNTKKGDKNDEDRSKSIEE